MRAFKIWLGNRLPIFWYILGFGIGVCTTLLYLGRPEWWAYLWSDEAAGWAAAIGTAFAAGVALFQGTMSIRRLSDEQRERTMKAATAMGASVLSAHANALAWSDFEAKHPDMSEDDRREIEEKFIAPDILSWQLDKEVDKFAIFFADLPGDVLRRVSILTNAYRESCRLIVRGIDPARGVSPIEAARRGLVPSLEAAARSLWATQHPGAHYFGDSPTASVEGAEIQGEAST